MKIKSAFTKLGLIEEDVVVTPKSKAAPATAPAQTNAAQFTAPSFYQPTAPTIDPAIGEMLSKSLQASKLSGFDYMKFTSSVEKMKSTGATEDVRFKMAYSTAQELGVDKTNLVESGNHYLSVLKENEGDFGADCAQFEKDEVTARETKLSQIETSITDLAKQLAQAQQDHATLQSELAEKKSVLESRKASFQATLQSFRATIEQNIQKINQYLQ
jgi:hypothetical protein